MMKQPKWMTYTGWAIAVVLAAQFAFSAYLKFAYPDWMSKDFEGKFGFEAKHAFIIGIIEAACLLIYLFPRTAVIGAVLLTGYLGGAVVTHLRANESVAAPVIVGVLVWLSVFLREPRLRPLMPWRQPLDLPQTK
jgi:hypothetical protein